MKEFRSNRIRENNKRRKQNYYPSHEMKQNDDFSLW